MTLARVLATGSGTLAWRVAIDGMPFEFVSHRGMERTAADGRLRCLGLQSDGFRFSESVLLPASKWDAQGLRVRLADIDHRATELFTKRPAGVTYLAADCDHDDTTITVLSTAGFASSGTIYVDGETITYTGKTATTFTGCTRGAYGSLDTSHYLSFGANLRSPEITDWPCSLEGRRVRIFAYGAGDSKQGDGTRAWTGIARTGPTSNGLTWSFLVDSMASLFDFELGGDLEEPRSIRGIYYPATVPLYLKLLEHDDADGPAISAETELAIAGFWETQEAFCADLTTLLTSAQSNTLSGTFTQTVRAVPIGPRWGLQFTTPASSERLMRAALVSPVDGGENLALVNRNTGAPESSVTASATYQLQLVPTDAHPTPGEVPRVVLAYPRSTSASYANSTAATNKSGIDTSTNPAGRIYLNGPAPTAAVTGAIVTFPGETDDGRSLAFDAAVLSTSTTLNYLTVDMRTAPYPAVIYVSGAESENVEIRMSRDFGAGNLRTFLQALENATRAYGVTGGTPFVRPTSGGNPSDFDLSDDGGGGVIAAAALAGGTITTARRFTLLAPVSLRDLIEHECKLLGIYPCLNASGQITFRPLALPTISSIALANINAGKIIVGDGFMSYEVAPYGSVNAVRYELGYDPVEDKSTADPVVIRDAVSFGRNPQPQVVICSPKSREGGSPIVLDELWRLASRVLTVFGGPYATLTIEAPLTTMSLLLGQVVSLTWSKVPSGSLESATQRRSLLGVTGKVGILIGRDFEPMSAKGKLTILLTDQRVGGYAPGAKLESQEDLGSDQWVLQLDNAYFPDGVEAEDLWEAGNKVRLFEWNSTTTTNNVTATVDSVEVNQLTVTVDSTWTPGAATWCVGSQVSTSITASNQKRFVFLAGSDGDLDWSDETDQPPFTFA